LELLLRQHLFAKAHQCNFLRSADGVLGAAASIAPAFGREGLVVVLSQVHAELGPCIKVALGGDGTAAGSLLLPVADVLPEGGRALDRGLVDLLVLPDVVNGTVASDGADLLALSGAGTVAGEFLDVVLDQRVGGPAVDGDENGTRVGLGGTIELDVSVSRVSLQPFSASALFGIPGGSSPPALADYEVTGTGEGDRVSVVGGAELNISAGLVVLVVVLTTGQGGLGRELKVGSIGVGVSGRGSEGAGYGRQSDSEVGEGDHFDDWLYLIGCDVW
jgi:hypothetical protein